MQVLPHLQASHTRKIRFKEKEERRSFPPAHLQFVQKNVHEEDFSLYLINKN